MYEIITIMDILSQNIWKSLTMHVVDNSLIKLYLFQPSCLMRLTRAYSITSVFAVLRNMCEAHVRVAKQ